MFSPDAEKSEEAGLETEKTEKTEFLLNETKEPASGRMFYGGEREAEKTGHPSAGIRTLYIDGHDVGSLFVNRDALTAKNTWRVFVSAEKIVAAEQAGLDVFDGDSGYYVPCNSEESALQTYDKLKSISALDIAPEDAKSKERYRAFLRKRIADGTLTASENELKILADFYEHFPIGKKITNKIGEEIVLSPQPGGSIDEYIQHFAVKRGNGRENFSQRHLDTFKEIFQTTENFDDRILQMADIKDKNGNVIGKVPRILFVRSAKFSKTGNHLVVVAVSENGLLVDWTHEEVRNNQIKKYLEREKEFVEQYHLKDAQGKILDIGYDKYLEEKMIKPMYLASALATSDSSRQIANPNRSNNIASNSEKSSSVPKKENTDGRFDIDSDAPLLTPEEDANDFQLIDETKEEAAKRDRLAEQAEQKRQDRIARNAAEATGDLFSAEQQEKNTQPEQTGTDDEEAERLEREADEEEELASRAFAKIRSARPGSAERIKAFLELPDGPQSLDGVFFVKNGNTFERDGQKLSARGIEKSFRDQTTAPAQKIEDFGEKIGGARKDLAEKTGPRQKSADGGETVSTGPRWRDSYVVDQLSNDGKWTIFRKPTGSRRALSVITRNFFDTREQAENALPALYIADKYRFFQTKSGQTAIYRHVPSSRSYVPLKGGFASKEEAMRWALQNVDELEKIRGTYGERDLATKPDYQRTGSRRLDHDATAKDFADAFGFRGVEFGNWENQNERQLVMNDAYEALHDLADLLHLPPRAISLEGQLGLAFGSRGHGGSARAHYESDFVVINLTKPHGAGTFAHEWFHALDNYFRKQAVGDTTPRHEFISDKTTNGGEPQFNVVNGKLVRTEAAKDAGVRPELFEKFKALKKAIMENVRPPTEEEQKGYKKSIEANVDELREALAQLRQNLIDPPENRYRKRKIPSATEEQLKAFDRIADKLLADDAPKMGYKALASGSYPRRVNDDIVALNDLYKSITGRSGFKNDGNGAVDNIRQRLFWLQSSRERLGKRIQERTSFLDGAMQLDKYRSEGYWSHPWEMFARAFSAFIEDKLASEGRKSEYLSYGSDNALYNWKIDEADRTRPFPEGEERTRINAAFQDLFDTMKTETTPEGKTRLYSIADRDASLQRLDGVNIRDAISQRIEQGISKGEYRLKHPEDKQKIIDGAVKFFEEFSTKTIPLSNGHIVYFMPDKRAFERGDRSAWAEYCMHQVTSGGTRIPGKDYAERWYNHTKLENLDQIEVIIRQENVYFNLNDKNPRDDSIEFVGQTPDHKRMTVLARLDDFGNINADLTEVTFVNKGKGKNNGIEFPPPKPLTEVVEAVVHHQGAGYSPSTKDNVPQSGEMSSGETGNTGNTGNTAAENRGTDTDENGRERTDTDGDGQGFQYSLVTDTDRLRELDRQETNGEYLTLYRAAQLVDGKLYPPMAAKVNGRFVPPIELGKWEQADEHPELADDDGKFKLDKGNGSSIKARYNPYIHSSPSPLNDQFSSAYKRPELVTLEVRVPKSELASGYHAEKAFDPVGMKKWKNGSVAGKENPLDHRKFP